jgi:hypothetical protein
MDTYQNITPLLYFQNLLEEDKSTHLIKEFITDFVENSGEINFEIDYSKGVITYYGCYSDDKGNQLEGDYITSDFNLFFEAFVQKQCEKSKYQIQTIIHDLAFNGKTYYPFLDLQKKILHSLIEQAQKIYCEYPFINSKLYELNNFIETFEAGTLIIGNNSYCLSPEITLEKLHLLFTLLKNNSIIDSLENEFINAFTNKEVKYGIKWLDKARSGELNKQSIFYLIEKLINNKIILDVSNSDYNKKIEYVFRDRMGNILNNVRQSKSTFLNSNYQNEIIDNIISSL